MRDTAKAAANESAFRELNESLEEKADEITGRTRPTPYLCECEDEGCTDVIMLTREQYEAVRANPRTFVLALGHQSADDHVLNEELGFTIVEKTGEEGNLVEDQDPRS